MNCGKISQGIGAKPGTFQNPREERVLGRKENRAFNGVTFYKMQVSIGWAAWNLFVIVIFFGKEPRWGSMTG